VILEKLIRYRPSASKFPIIVSQDCMDDETANVIRAYADRGVELYQQPNQTDPMPKSATKKERKWSGYFKIARHYKFALTTVFAHEKKFDSVIIVEDDLDIAPDFFEYFTVGRQLLKADPTLYCVSAWNDNGKGNHVADPAKLYVSPLTSPVHHTPPLLPQTSVTPPPHHLPEHDFRGHAGTEPTSSVASGG